MQAAPYRFIADDPTTEYQRPIQAARILASRSAHVPSGCVTKPFMRSVRGMALYVMYDAATYMG